MSRNFGISYDGLLSVSLKASGVVYVFSPSLDPGAGM